MTSVEVITLASVSPDPLASPVDFYNLVKILNLTDSKYFHHVSVENNSSVIVITSALYNFRNSNVYIHMKIYIKKKKNNKKKSLGPFLFIIKIILYQT